MKNTALKLYLSMGLGHNDFTEGEIDAFVKKQSPEDQEIIDMINRVILSCVEEEAEANAQYLTQYEKAVDDTLNIMNDYIDAIGGTAKEFDEFVKNGNKLPEPRKNYVPVEGQKIQMPIPGGYMIKQAYVEE